MYFERLCSSKLDDGTGTDEFNDIQTRVNAHGSDENKTEFNQKSFENSQ